MLGGRPSKLMEVEAGPQRRGHLPPSLGRWGSLEEGRALSPCPVWAQVLHLTCRPTEKGVLVVRAGAAAGTRLFLIEDRLAVRLKEVLYFPGWLRDSRGGLGIWEGWAKVRPWGSPGTGFP